jgi:hypothetical protein
MTDTIERSIDYRKRYFSVILKLTGFLFIAAMIVGILLSFLVMPVQAIKINPSVDNQPILCKYSITKWIFCDTNPPGARGVNGTQGPKGESNFSAIYYNASYFTSNQTNATFSGNFTNAIMYSNYTTFLGSTIYDSINESYAYLPGRSGGQLLQGGTTTGNLVLNGSGNNGAVSLNPNGGNVFVGPVSSVGATFTVLKDGGIPSVEIEGYATPSSNAPFFSFYRAKGNLSVPLAVANLNRLGVVAFTGYSGSAWKQGAQIIATAEQAWSSTQDGAYISFTTADLYSTTVTEKMRLTANGTLLVGATSTNLTGSGLDVVGATTFRNCSGTPTMDTFGQMTCASDPKFKTAVQPYISDTAKVAAVTPIKYRWNAASGYDTTHTNTGFDAAQIKLVYPECVIAREDMRYEQRCTGKGEEEVCDTVAIPTGTQTLALDDKCLIAVLWNAAKDQQMKITSLESRLTALEKGVVKP